MTSFYNDYNELCHPAVLKDMVGYCGEKNVGYSEDYHVKNAVSYLKRDLGDESVDIHFVHGGTIVNVLGLLIGLNRFEGVVSADTGHIVNTENGSIEAVGLQIIQTKNRDGKVTVEGIKKALHDHSHEYCVEPKLVYISNATELGTIYKKAELEELSTFCKKNSLYMFMDGARIGTALGSRNNDLTMRDLTKYFDVFSIGGTKNGMLLGEALVIVNPDLKKGTRKLIKQRGALLAKGYIYGIQFETMFKDGLFYKIARHASDMAVELTKVFKSRGVELVADAEANLVFAKLSGNQIEKLSRTIHFQVGDQIGDNLFNTRFATTWATTMEDIDAVDKAFKGM